jgi:hypothetical protein
VPSHKKNLERISALADALEARGIGPFATVVKARPCDVEPASFRVLRDRLHTIRVYVGIETDADQGLVTLDRRIASRQNHEALKVMRELDLFACFNMLIFDPDTTMSSLETNVAFMESASDFSFNFCRTELYAGTPLLHRMLAEGRTTGDWLHYDYRLKTPQVQRAFELTIEAFTPRNFGGHALHNDMGGWRLQMETARHFHRDVFDPAWREAMTALHRRVGADTVSGLRAILAHVRSGEDRKRDAAFVRELGVRLRGFEAEIRREWSALYAEMAAACAASQPDPVSIGVDATPLQDQRGIAELHYV